MDHYRLFRHSGQRECNTLCPDQGICSRAAPFWDVVYRYLFYYHRERIIFSPVLDDYLVYNFTRLEEIEVIPFLTDTGSELRGVVVTKACMVILATITLYASVCEILFAVSQFRSGYFDFVEQWTKPIPEHKLHRARTLPVRTVPVKTRPPLTRVISVDPKVHKPVSRIISAP